MIVAGTGHRPNKLGGYNNESFIKLINIAENALKQIEVTEVISGMALGWDMALAQAAINLNIPFIAAIPFKGYENMWQDKSKKYFYLLLSKAKEVKYICDGDYSPDKMQIRNKWMVDNSDLILSMYNGDKSGGTYNCIKYIETQKKQHVNLYEKFNK
jgi:uncharacterized phage-like protein YoqJ